MVINSHRQGPLRSFLAHNVVVQDLIDLLGLGKISKAERVVIGARKLVLNDFITQLDTFIADIDPRASDQFSDLVLVLTTK